MSSLSSKSAQDISELLDEYGIKHGPVVDSTRSLYERKLKEAMAKGRRAKPSPDKTFYREEEEVTYEYRTPVRSDGAGESWSYMRSRPEWNERESQHETSYSSISRSKPEYRGRDLVDETSYSTYSKSKPEYRGRDLVDETSYSSISRSKPEYRGRDLVDETSYSTYSSSKPEYRGRDLVDGPHMYDTPSTYRSSYLKSTPVKPQEAPKAPKASRLIPLWIQFVFFIAVAVFLYLVFSNMETNESLKGIEGL